MMPTKEVIAKLVGTVMSWDHKASLGLIANREKSGSYKGGRRGGELDVSLGFFFFFFFFIAKVAHH